MVLRSEGTPTSSFSDPLYAQCAGNEFHNGKFIQCKKVEKLGKVLRIIQDGILKNNPDTVNTCYRKPPQHSQALVASGVEIQKMLESYPTIRKNSVPHKPRLVSLDSTPLT